MKPVSGRPRVALIATTWHQNSHADVVGRRLLEGYRYRGEHVEPRIEIVSAYVEQQGVSRPNPREDVSAELLGRSGVPVFPTVAEALGLAEPGLAVDGIIIIGEHGDYEENEFGQKLYPRRRLFDSAVSVMIASGRIVPVFVDKHLAWSTADTLAMYQTAVRLGIPLLAGSSIPLAIREPDGADWPPGASMTDCLGVGYSAVEAYGFHALEAAQAIAERRSGGETGVLSVEAVRGDDARAAVEAGRVDLDLLGAALDVAELSERQKDAAIRGITAVFWITHVDGLRETVVMTDEVSDFLVAAVGPETSLACRMRPGDEIPDFFPHFGWLVRQIESLIIERAAPYPVERTVLTGGILDAALHSIHAGGAQATPELEIAYPAPGELNDVGYRRPERVS